MSRKRLATTEMLYVSAEWVDSTTPVNQAILAHTDLASTLPRIQTAHLELSAAARPTALNPRLFAIIKEQTDVDDRHDDVIRGIFGLLTSTAALLGGDEGARLLSLRDQLIPAGLATVQKSYAAEAGEAAQVATVLTPDVRAQLDKILVGPKTPQHKLTTYFDEWIQLGKRLGELEAEKARLQTDESTGATNVTLLSARNKWLRAVNLLLAIAEAAELTPELDKLIFGPLRLAEAKADKRVRPSESGSESPAATPENP